MSGKKLECFQLDPHTHSEALIATCSAFLANPDANILQRFDAYLARAIAYRAIGDYEQSEADLLTILEHDPDNAQTLRMLAWTYREWGQPSKAEEIYTRVLNYDNHWQAWLSRCAVRVDLARYEDAIADCEEANRAWKPDRVTHPNVSYDIAYFTALSLNSLGRFDEAHEIAIAHADAKDINARLFHQSGVALWNSGQEDAAVDTIFEGWRYYPQDPDLLDFFSQTGIRPQ